MGNGSGGSDNLRWMITEQHELSPPLQEAQCLQLLMASCDIIGAMRNASLTSSQIQPAAPALYMHYIVALDCKHKRGQRTEEWASRIIGIYREHGNFVL